MKNSLVVLYVLFLSQISLIAQDSTKVVPQRTYVAMPIKDMASPIIDGLLNDKGWDLTEWTGDFIELKPDENTPPTYQSKFKILYDDKNLYVGIRCYDPDPSKIEKRLSRRDGFAGDYAEMHIDSYNDKRFCIFIYSYSSRCKGG